MNIASLKTLVQTNHPLREGERDRQRALLQRNASLMAEYGGDRRGGYAAVAALTPLATGITFSEEFTAQASGCWSIPERPLRDCAILFIHGGGYHLGDARSYRGLTSQLATRTNCAVFSADYPLSPENRFPAAFEAIVQARNWLSAQGISQIALVGDSAGGGLALATLGEALPNGTVASVVVFSPWTDLALTGASFRDPETHDPIFTPSMLADLAESYLHGADTKDRRASPLYAIPDHLPPLAIQVGSDELLLDDSRRYAKLAAKIGGIVALDIFMGMHHVFQRDAGSIETADFALDLTAQFINAHWTRSSG
ncbi:alpha/beta hydrolase [Occallatibacter savannae]|uniref:alpha/beta hydrolase n=1 Tax=Occallatibacter savannae TaxID=1002691 RepID=UPI000D6963AD|nr:alpha/beta hydrolase [Occallatibacter savannae]